MKNEFSMLHMRKKLTINKMEITWHGNSCISIEENKKTILINPEAKMGNFNAQVVLSSLKEIPTDIEGVVKIFDCPGEYEVQNIHIFAYPAWVKSKSEENPDEKIDKTIIFIVKINGVNFCHLGALGHSLPSDTLKEIGDIDVLFIEMGDNTNLNLKKGIELLENLDPRVIIPMGNYKKEDFLKEYGLEKLDEVDSFSIKEKSNLPSDETKVVFLKNMSAK